MGTQHGPWAHLGLPMVEAGWSTRWIHMNREMIIPTGITIPLLATWVEVQDREQHSAELPVSKGEGQTPAPRQQESVTTFRHSPRQETALDGTRSWKVKSKQLAISDFAKLGQDYRACYFLISHRNSRTTSGKHNSVERVQTAMKMLQQFFCWFFFSFSLSLSMILILIS